MYLCMWRGSILALSPLSPHLVPRPPFLVFHYQPGYLQFWRVLVTWERGAAFFKQEVVCFASKKINKMNHTWSRPTRGYFFLTCLMPGLPQMHAWHSLQNLWSCVFSKLFLLVEYVPHCSTRAYFTIRKGLKMFYNMLIFFNYAVCNEEQQIKYFTRGILIQFL